MTTGMDEVDELTAAEKAECIAQGISKIREGAVFLNSVYDDERIKYCLSELEGLDFGWFHREGDDREYLIDLLDDVRLELLGTPIADHWRGHATTEEEASQLFHGNGIPT